MGALSFRLFFEPIYFAIRCFELRVKTAILRLENAVIRLKLLHLDFVCRSRRNLLQKIGNPSHKSFTPPATSRLAEGHHHPDQRAWHIAILFRCVLWLFISLSSWRKMIAR
jgi:hypothetical protein